MSNLEPLQTIFKDCMFCIPDYQRGYAWQKRQLTDLWEDVINLPINRFHYTGMLSIKLASKDEWNNAKWDDDVWLIKDRGMHPYFVVDGQQRLTTFIIFINEIVNLFRYLPEIRRTRIFI